MKCFFLMYRNKATSPCTTVWWKFPLPVRFFGFQTEQILSCLGRHFLFWRSYLARRYFGRGWDLYRLRLYWYEAINRWTLCHCTRPAPHGSKTTGIVSVLWQKKKYIEIPVFRQGWVLPAVQTYWWSRTFPVAKECFWSTPLNKAGIQVASGRTFHWTAKGYSACPQKKQRLLIYCALWRKYSFYRMTFFR